MNLKPVLFKLVTLRILDDVLKRPRILDYKPKSNEPPFPVLWVQTFGPATNQIMKTIENVNKVAKLSVAWKGVQKVVGIVNRRDKNIGNIILKRKCFALDEIFVGGTGTTSCTPVGGSGKPGRPCKSCNKMSKKSTVKSFVTGKTYKTPSANCRSKNVIYLADCLLCQMQYTGQTTTKTQKRVCAHRSHVNKQLEDKESDDEDKNDEAALAEHLKLAHNIESVELFDQSYVFTILEIEPENLDKSEQKWISELVTMEPYGINRAKPCGAADSILTLTEKAKASSNSQRN